MKLRKTTDCMKGNNQIWQLGRYEASSPAAKKLHGWVVLLTIDSVGCIEVAKYVKWSMASLNEMCPWSWIGSKHSDRKCFPCKKQE